MPDTPTASLMRFGHGDTDTYPYSHMQVASARSNARACPRMTAVAIAHAFGHVLGPWIDGIATCEGCAAVLVDDDAHAFARGAGFDVFGSFVRPCPAVVSNR